VGSSLEFERELGFNAGMSDQPIAALIKDLKQRGLLDETLVVWGSEFGRTPLGENRKGREANTGRDHHPYSFTLFMAGGGTKGGLTYGATDDIGWNITKIRCTSTTFTRRFCICLGWII
jgi:uncharacterized protein (DUF1501 family)